MIRRFLARPYAPGVVLGVVLATVAAMDSAVGGALDAGGWACLAGWAFLSAGERAATPAWILTSRQTLLRALQVCALGAFLAGAALLFWDLWRSGEPVIAGGVAAFAGFLLSRWNPLVPSDRVSVSAHPPLGTARGPMSFRDDEMEL